MQSFHNTLSLLGCVAKTNFVANLAGILENVRCFRVKKKWRKSDSLFPHVIKV